MRVKMIKTVFAADTNSRGIKQPSRYYMRGVEYEVCKELAGVFSDLGAIESPNGHVKAVAPPENKDVNQVKRGRGRPRKNPLNASSQS